MLTLFHSPGACSMGIVFLLEELGVDYTLAAIDLRKGEQNDTAFRQMNPKGKVPTLILDDGTALTEFPAIAYWLCRRFGAAELWPDTIDGQARVLELVEFLVASIHMRGFTFLAMPQKFSADPAAQDSLRALGRREVETGLATVAAQHGAALCARSRIGIEDAALFYILVWARALGIAVPEPLSTYAEALLARPSAQVALRGLAAG